MEVMELAAQIGKAIKVIELLLILNCPIAIILVY